MTNLRRLEILVEELTARIHRPVTLDESNLVRLIDLEAAGEEGLAQQVCQIRATRDVTLLMSIYKTLSAALDEERRLAAKTTKTAPSSEKSADQDTSAIRFSLIELD